MKSLIGFLLITILFISTNAFASEIQINDLIKNPNLTSQEREAVVSALSKYTKNIPLDPQNVDKWMEVGDAFAETIKKICQTLNVEVNTFLKSDVGKLTAVVIIYKMVGKDFLRIGIYSVAMTIITLMIGFVWYIAFIKKRVKDKTGAVEYISRMDISEEMKWGILVISAILWVAFIGILLASII